MQSSDMKDQPILVLGRAGMDLYADPPGAEIEHAKNFTSALGGSAANIAAGIAKLGGDVALISTVSDDAVGRFVINELHSYGVAKDYVTTISGESRTSLAVVETRSDNCQSVIYRNAAADLQLTENQLRKVPFEKFGTLIVTGTSLALEPSRSATVLAMKLAREAGLSIILDVDYRPYTWANADIAKTTYVEAAALCDIVIGNDVEFNVMSPDHGLDFAKSISIDKIIVYKMGEHGSITFCNKTEFNQEIFKVKALKPTGAGDAFMAAFVMGLKAKLDLKTSVKRGSAAAAIVVTKVGCAPAMPTEVELNTFINHHNKS
jgi:5-dehydro-2-deoxygluconokinase